MTELTNQKLNEAVAIKFGYKFIDGGTWQSPKAGGTGWSDIEVPDYCGNIGAAWELVDTIPKYLWCALRYKPNHGWNCVIADDLVALVEVIAETPAIAICKAFLKFDLSRGTTPSIETK